MEKSLKVIGRAITLTFGVALLTTVLASTATAGCGSYDPQQPRSYNLESNADQSQSDTGSSDNRYRNGSHSIVGMWKVSFTATDGSGFSDFGYAHLHSDGTEFLNSGSRAPATQNYCLGVWQKTGYRSYQLNHFALSYDFSTGVLNGKVSIREKIALDPGGDTFRGTFLIDVYDPKGATIVAHFEGKLTGTRVTVDTLRP
jgi:hypothetical protein